MSVATARARDRSLSISTSSRTRARSTTAMAVAAPTAPTPMRPSFMSPSRPVVRRAGGSPPPDHGHKWQEGDRRPMRGEQTANGGADAIDQKHPDLPLRGEGQTARRPQHGLGRRGHDGSQRAREHDGRDSGSTNQPRRNALDPHSRRGDDDKTIETDSGDRLVDELPCQGEGGEKASFERKKPTHRARYGKLLEPEINARRSRSRAG